jgi:hypothetical protein
LTWSPEGGRGGGGGRRRRRRRRRTEMKWAREVKRVLKQKTGTPIGSVNWQIW